MVDAIISAVVEDLTSMMLSCSSIQEEARLMTGVNDEVKKLVCDFKSIQPLLDDAEEQQLKKASVQKWLFDVKAVSYDMDDVLDEWKTWIQTSQLQHRHHSSGSNQNHLKHKVLSIFSCICFTTCDVGLRHVVGGRIKEIHHILDDIATDEVRYELSSTNISDKPIERHVTTSFVDTQKVKGRDKEKEIIKRKVLEAQSNPQIISILGMGGIGKTTLAQLVYNDGLINIYFEKKIWVSVSDPFDKMGIAKAILKSLSDSSTAHNFKELDKVLKEINAFLSKKRFLLVLDDVWNESPSEWEELEQILTCGSLGSTILITTRNERVTIAMGCTPGSIFRLELLTTENCWSIISDIACANGDGPRFESIGRRIADKCKGLPLAATTIGGLLRFKKSEKEWLRVLEKKEWQSEDIMGTLKLSYYALPLSLKPCFSYCAIFPKDSIIKKRRLIGMWMAQGYLKEKEKDEDLEIIGQNYFEDLIALSLLQISSDHKDFVLHDMVSDLAHIVAKDECLMIEVLEDTELNGNSLHASVNVRHVRHLTLTIKNNASFPIFIYDLNKLRSLIIHSSTRGSPTVDELQDIFDHLTCLRTLDLSRCDIEEIPSLINRLVHLRWLDLSENANIQKLPETLCECYNLQTLILTRCWNLVNLPKRIGKLINLMYLDIEDSSKIKYLPKGIGNLSHLRELTVFIIRGNDGESFSIVEMERLNNLRGRLEIRGLGNVRKLEEAEKAQLKEKKRVTELSLSFDGDDVQEDEEELLEALEPPSNLKILSIEKYRGKMLFPSWMMKLNLLRKLTIDESRNCEELPPLGKLLCLEELDLRDMRVKRVGVEFMGIEKGKDASTSFLSFPKLKILRFEMFRQWEEWDDIDEWLIERINNKTITIMSSLQELFMNDCPKLKTLPYYLLSSPITTGLQKLSIFICEILEQEVIKDKLFHIPNLTIAPGRLEIRGLGSVNLEEIRKAQLEKKKNVIKLSLGFDGDRVQENEEELLEALEPPSDLKILRIDEFKGKTLFPSWIMKLNLLRKLTIDESRNCEELPPLGKLLCLEELDLRDMRVKKVGVEFLAIEKEKEKDTSTSFRNLKILSFDLFHEWEEWDDIDEWLMERINNKTITVMPSLQKLCIYRCTKLKTLPYHLLLPPVTTRLQELDVYDPNVLKQEVKDKFSHMLRIRPGQKKEKPNSTSLQTDSKRYENVESCESSS